jgi:malonyl-CoA/methylmalonyl-CoA synthetase
MNLYTFLAQGFLPRAQSPAMLLPSGETWTYARLTARSAQYAHALVAAGAKPGDRVAVQVEKSAEAVALYLGCLRAGAVFLPLNTGYQKSELAYFVGNAEPSVIVCDPEKKNTFDEIVVADALTPALTQGERGQSKVFTLNSDGLGTMASAANTCGAEFDTLVRDDSDLAAILYTSGTTGRSKGAMLTHANLASNADTLVKYWGFTANDVLLHMLPIYHVHGLFVALHCVLRSGAAMLFEPKFEGVRAKAMLANATVMMGVPTFYTRLLTDAHFGKEDCKTIRLFVSGSAPLLAETHIEFTARTGQKILERYGMTETGMNTSNPLVGERIAGTVGLPLPGTQARVRDDAGNLCGSLAIGGIEVKGPNVFPGYWRMPEKNAEEFTSDGFFKTGDMGQWLENGYLQIVGREKDLIITGGLNVYPKEIEEKIDAMTGVLESAVIGVPHPDFGEAVVAVVVGKANAALNSAAMVAELKADLANFKVPKAIHIVPDLPRNAMGKVQKNLLRAQYAPAK